MFFVVKYIYFLLLVALIVVFGVFLFSKKEEDLQEIMTVQETVDQKGEQESESPLLEESFHPDTIPAMMEKDFQGDDLKVVKVLDENDAYTRNYITYTSEGFLISGIMNVPKGEGTFPVLILNHGYIDPAVYRNGQGLKREQDFLAKVGYVVIHSDYRNHAESDFDSENEVRPRSGYVEDIMNLLSAVQKSEYGFLDKKNVGMLGHSMGGGITINVMTIAPENVKAYVLMAPINSNYKENFERWVAPEWPDLANQVFEKYGNFEQNPEFWKGVSAVNYLDNVKAPVMLHQGTDDPDVPVGGSRELAEALKKAAKETIYFEYPDEGHLFLNTFDAMITRSVDFFDEKLKN
jgi:dipeptidyl aminopeptidase/acylaminoacyl peptidase